MNEKTYFVPIPLRPLEGEMKVGDRTFFGCAFTEPSLVPRHAAQLQASPHKVLELPGVSRGRQIEVRIGDEVSVRHLCS